MIRLSVRITATDNISIAELRLWYSTVICYINGYNFPLRSQNSYCSCDFGNHCIYMFFPFHIIFNIYAIITVTSLRFHFWYMNSNTAHLVNELICPNQPKCAVIDIYVKPDVSRVFVDSSSLTVKVVLKLTHCIHISSTWFSNRRNTIWKSNALRRSIKLLMKQDPLYVLEPVVNHM